jgi:hypothetical protein
VAVSVHIVHYVYSTAKSIFVLNMKTEHLFETFVSTYNSTLSYYTLRVTYMHINNG